jgi:asparagine synthase (glutamine-hydrolysing)
MCGIAGLLDLSGKGRTPDRAMIENMSNAMFDERIDDSDFFIDKGIALISSGLTTIDPQSGTQANVSNDKSVYTVYTGENFNCRSIKNSLSSKGIRFACESFSEMILHLWLEYNTKMWDLINGQFAIAV